MVDIAAYAPQILAAFMDAATLTEGGGLSPYLDAGHTDYHLTTHVVQADGTAHGTVNFACDNITARFVEIANAAGSGRMQDRMRDNIALVEMLDANGPLTINDPHAVLNQGYVINTLRNYMANGHDEQSARQSMAQQPQVQLQVEGANPAVQRDRAQQAGRPYLAQVTIGCAR